MEPGSQPRQTELPFNENVPNLHWIHTAASNVSEFQPCGQDTHVPVPSFLYVPVVHGLRTQVILPSTDVSPIEHASHEVFRPETSENVSTAQRLHFVWAWPSLYCPGKQSRHNDLPTWSWYLPEIQLVHTCTNMLPRLKSDSLEKRPTSQTAHAVSELCWFLFALLTFLPGGQELHEVAPPEAKRPVPQDVHLISLLGNSENVSTPQSTHFSATPIWSFQRPASQSMQKESPFDEEYFPFLQAVQLM